MKWTWTHEIAMNERFNMIDLITASSYLILDYSIQTEPNKLTQKVFPTIPNLVCLVLSYALTLKEVLLSSVLLHVILVHSLQKPIQQK